MRVVPAFAGETGGRARASWRPRWHRLYYLLAAFDLLTVALSLALNHQTRGVFDRSVDVNQVWGQRLAAYSELGQLAADVNAPGNDVFDSRDADAESGRMRAALRLFEERFAALREEVRANVDAAQAARVLDDFDTVAAAMAEMTEEAELIFSYYAQGRPALAGPRMATMDRKYGNVQTALARLRRDVAVMQQENLEQQDAMATSLSKFEYLIAAAILLMISAATVYGHNLAKRVDADARERERYVAELRDAEARTRSIVDTAADGIVTFDEKGVIESANASAARLFGADAVTLIGQHVSRLVPDLFPEGRPTGFEPDLVSGSSDRVSAGLHRETVGRRADDTTFPLELAVSEFGLGGKRMFTAIIRDVTERKRSEEQHIELIREQAARAEAEAAVSMRDEFLSVAAHELKTPVTGLRGFAELALEQLEEEGAVDRRVVARSLRVIQQQSMKLARLVSQLLDVSRIEAGKLSLDRSVTDVASLVESVAEAAQVGTARHTLVVSSAPSVPTWVDPLRIEQVVTNLIDNAIKYSPTGGQIDIEVVEPLAGTVRLAVRDRGVGIPPDSRRHIFDRFYRAHAQDHASGMGLGLYISREIVELHGGRIEVESPADGGTRFVVVLPANTTETTASSKETA